jgi:formylglycine-generating enzyme required for sulfatase activity
MQHQYLYREEESMASIEKTVFISYRRKDRYQALAVYQHVTGQQYDVFLDYASIPSGDFAQIIVSNIKARAHFILILTPTALDRCSEPNDWLRREIETAIDEKRNIIPLFFDGFSFSVPGVAEKLTGKLGAIKRYNGLEIPPYYFNEAMEKLCGRFLNVPLNAVIHPVPTDVLKAVEDAQVAANQALEQERDNIDKFFRSVRRKLKPSESSQTYQTVVQPTSRRKNDSRNWRLYGIGAGVLMAVGLGIAALNAFLPNPESAIPTQAVTHAPATSPFTSPPTQPTASTTSQPPLSVPTMESEVDGMNLLYVPEGEFIMGSETGEKDEVPIHTVFLDAFWIDQTEVTNAMYVRCVRDGPCTPAPPRAVSTVQANYHGNPAFDNYPVVHVSWEDARTYCEWAERRLPTEAEWEKAARGTDARIYPWGNDPLPNDSLLNYQRPESEGKTTEVGSYPEGASPYGALDMAGNVREWVADWYSDTYYKISPTLNPSGLPVGEKRVIRGGGWAQGPRDVRS